ncbi:MAG: hypothetical protein JHC26_00335 [Thermofilum sp.]|jgi:hypothetical protein|uniref:hypothetical protein n=1 Tax=Thermofilum sp. TaxID=1961369 RepID=UPI002588D0F5|nr:hypothetical protein [Thermofilum sp.]MCI4407512.1 hypothetical protein [Thermofilum sp.]
MSTTLLGDTPENQNFLLDGNFTFILTRTPTVTYFTQGASIPGISLGVATYPGLTADQPLPGETLTFDDLTVTFKVDEDLKNYLEIQEWMRGLGFPYSQNEYGDLVKNPRPTDKFPNPSDVRARRSSPVPDTNDFSDGTLTVLNNNNHPIIDVTFVRMFPYTLSSLDFSTANSNTTEITATVNFKYAYYYFIN